MTSRTLRFSVDNQLLSELGERLVAKNYVALAELIKNAYDADADRVEVTLETKARKEQQGRRTKVGRIVVTDIGQGMTAAEVEDYWMRVATDNKIREPRTQKYGRHKTGSKGVGRFACRRLADHLAFRSVARVSSGFEVTTMEFDWARLVPGKDLSAETFVANVTSEQGGTPGVTLTMSGLKDHWTRRDFNVLRRSLVDVSIANAEQRRGYKRDPGFAVILKSDEFPTKDERLSEQYLNAGWGRLSCAVSSHGRAALILKSKGTAKKNFILPGKFAHCAGIEFDIAWIPGAKDYWRDPKLMTNQVRRELEDTEGGIKVYLDGFRVYPYGEAGTDWLEISRMLAKRAGGVNKMFAGIASKLGVDPGRALLLHPKETTLVGKVLLPQIATRAFVVKMDREGFVENDAFLELRHLVQLALQWMTIQYVHYKQSMSEARIAAEVEELRPLLGTVSAAPQAALSAAIAVIEKAGQKGVDAVPGQGRTVATAASIIRRSTDIMDAKVSKLQILASTGPLVFAFAHEIKSLFARLTTHANKLDDVCKKTDGPHAETLRAIAADLRETRNRLDHEVQLFGAFAKSTADDKPKRQPIGTIVSDIAAGFSFVCSSFGIEVDTSDIESHVKTDALRSAEVYSMLVNLVSNAIKASIAGGGKRISIAARRSDAGLVIRICDSGVGLAESHWHRVFEPLVTDPENRIYPKLERLIEDEDVRSLGRGSGLGLSIVRDIATSHGGEVQFVKPAKPWRTCVELRLP